MPQVAARTPLVRRRVRTGPRPDGRLGTVTTVRAMIITPDLDRLLAFYGRLLGAEEVERMPAEGLPFYVGLRLGDSDLGLIADAGVDLGAAQRLLLSIEVPGIDALLDRVTELGGTVLSPPADMPWGQRVVHLRDPDGNAVNLTQDLEPAPRPRRTAGAAASGSRACSCSGWPPSCCSHP